MNVFSRDEYRVLNELDMSHPSKLREPRNLLKDCFYSHRVSHVAKIIFSDAVCLVDAKYQLLRNILKQVTSEPFRYDHCQAREVAPFSRIE